MSEELKDSGAVTALSVVGLVFGLIGMMGSFIPCLGSFSQKAKHTFAIRLVLTEKMLTINLNIPDYP